MLIPLQARPIPFCWPAERGLKHPNPGEDLVVAAVECVGEADSGAAVAVHSVGAPVEVVQGRVDLAAQVVALAAGDLAAGVDSAAVAVAAEPAAGDAIAPKTIAFAATSWSSTPTPALTLIPFR
jgi:hypothetical protein